LRSLLNTTAIYPRSIKDKTMSVRQLEARLAQIKINEENVDPNQKSKVQSFEWQSIVISLPLQPCYRLAPLLLLPPTRFNSSKTKPDTRF
jgi:hypothetical protein